MELDGGVARVTGLLDTLVASDTLQHAAADDRARAFSKGVMPLPAVMPVPSLLLLQGCLAWAWAFLIGKHSCDVKPARLP